MATRDRDAQSGTTRYRLLGAIHRGGMGEILLARAEGADGFSRKLVLKGLLPQLSEDSVSHDLFRREATLMARLEHPNVVRVIDFTYVDDQPYLAMEYVRGRNLHQLIQRGLQKGHRLPPRIAAHVVAEALRGLNYAHVARSDDGASLGIIHRDVSPGNILIGFFGEVKVTDFGIATAAGERKYTGPRSIRGKARYTAPEIIGGHPASVQSDVYAAGCVLAEALTGEPLWERGQLTNTLLAIVSEPLEDTLIRILRVLPEIEGLPEILRLSLGRRPEDRQPNALRFAEQLDALCRAEGGPVTTGELAQFVRMLFADAPDLPDEQGFVSDPLIAPMSPREDEEPHVSSVEVLPAGDPISAELCDLEEVPATPGDRPRALLGDSIVLQDLARHVEEQTRRERTARSEAAPEPKPEPPEEVWSDDVSDETYALLSVPVPQTVLNAGEPSSDEDVTLALPRDRTRLEHLPRVRGATERSPPPTITPLERAPSSSFEAIAPAEAWEDDHSAYPLTPLRPLTRVRLGELEAADEHAATARAQNGPLGPNDTLRSIDRTTRLALREAIRPSETAPVSPNKPWIPDPASDPTLVPRPSRAPAPAAPEEPPKPRLTEAPPSHEADTLKPPDEVPPRAEPPRGPPTLPAATLPPRPGQNAAALAALYSEPLGTDRDGAALPPIQPAGLPDKTVDLASFSPGPLTPLRPLKVSSSRPWIGFALVALALFAALIALLAR